MSDRHTFARHGRRNLFEKAEARLNALLAEHGVCRQRRPAQLHMIEGAAAAAFSGGKLVCI